MARNILLGTVNSFVDSPNMVLRAGQVPVTVSPYTGLQWRSFGAGALAGTIELESADAATLFVADITYGLIRSITLTAGTAAVVTTLAGGVGFFALSIALVPHIPQDFVPGADRGRSSIAIERTGRYSNSPER